MSKMHYGPRFRNTTVDTKYTEDRRIEDDLHKDHMRFAAYYNALPQYKKDLRGYATAQRSKKLAAKRRIGNEREESERRMAEAIRKVVEILEFHMEDMMQHRLMRGQQTYVCQPTIHNLIVDLRTKCGVPFDRGGQYDRHIDLARLHLTHDPSDEELDLRAKQQMARERKMRAVTDRLLARAKDPK